MPEIFALEAIKPDAAVASLFIVNLDRGALHWRLRPYNASSALANISGGALRFGPEGTPTAHDPARELPLGAAGGWGVEPSSGVTPQMDFSEVEVSLGTLGQTSVHAEDVVLVLTYSVVIETDDDVAGGVAATTTIVNNSHHAVGGTLTVHAVADARESATRLLGAPVAGESSEVLRILPRDSDGFEVCPVNGKKAGRARCVTRGCRIHHTDLRLSQL